MFDYVDFIYKTLEADRILVSVSLEPKSGHARWCYGRLLPPPVEREPVQNNTLVIDEHNIVADVLYLFLLIDFSALSYCRLDDAL